MIKKWVFYSAALVGSTFAFIAPLHAGPPVVKSEPDHVLGEDSSEDKQSSGPDTAFIENLMFQVQSLQEQVADQRGLIEELNYQIQILKREQKERYIDLDERILNLRQQVESAAQPTPKDSPDIGTDAVSNEDVLAEYNSARDLIKQRKFPQAIEALKEFANRHPDHDLAPNAWYWLGEVYQVNREVSKAEQAFKQVVETFPDHAKVPDSLYKLGVIAQQQGNGEKARRYFERVIADHPDTQSAKLSEARLNSN